MPLQNRLYEYFLENNPLKDKLGGRSLISDYTILRKIWTHPKVLENAYLNALREDDRKKDRLRRLNNDEDEDERPDDFLDSQEGKMSVKNDWWRPHVTNEDLETILPSNKLKILFEILKVCRENGEKCLIFSAFVAVLDVVEFFMKAITKQTQEGASYKGLENYRGIWKYAEDYYRLDGKTPRSTRHQMITNFNDPKNQRARVFLISAKAGGQGINLTGANRVILLDTSWNPSNDRECESEENRMVFWKLLNSFFCFCIFQNKIFSAFFAWDKKKSAISIVCWPWALWRKRSIRVPSPSKR